MYNTSADYKEYIKKPSRQFECKVVIGNRTFNNSDIIQIVPNATQPKSGFSIGNTISQSVDITLRNDGGVYASAGKAEVEIGLKTNNSMEWILIGTFNIDDVTKTDYTVKITAYDNMFKFETGYFSNLGDTPTLQEVVNELASITGIDFAGTVPNYTVTKLQGFTCREVLGYVASACGGNAYITRDGKFTIAYPTEVDNTITADNYITYKLEDQVYKIGMITCQNKSNINNSDSGYDSANDKNTISVGSLSAYTMELAFENPWISETILNDIYSKLKDFSYLGYTLKWQGDLSLDPMDIVTIIDKNNITRKALVFANKLTYTGGLVAETSAKGETKNSNSFNASGPITKNVERLSVKLLIAEQALINKASIQDLQANSARINNLEASVATIDTALINYATVTQLDAVKANIADLNASVANIDSALINKANVADLTAANANISNLSATVANISTLVNGNLTSANIQSLVLTSSKVTVDNGFIKNAMIESLDVAKINAGTLNTNKISVSSADGGMIIAGATQQFKDSSGNVRLQLGQDAQGNFNFILKASDGTTTLIDGYGVKEKAIADKLIKQNMVADSAIGEQQINYSSFVTGFNKSTNTNYINASKVSVDLTGQTLDISFNNMNTTVNGLQTTTSNNSTAISAIQGQISTLISNTTITNNGTTTQLKDAYNSTVNTVNSMQTTIGQHTTQINTANSNITSVNSSISSIQANLSSISASLSSTQSTVSSQGTQITTANNNISNLNTNVSNVSSRVSSLELTANSLTTRVGNTETAISSLQIGGRNLIRNSHFNFGGQYWTDVDQTALDGIYGNCALRRNNTYSENYLISNSIRVKPNTTYTFSIIAGGNGYLQSWQAYAIGRRSTDSDYSYIYVHHPIGLQYNTSYQKFMASFTTNSDETFLYIRIDNNGSNTSGQSADLWVAWVKLEEGNKPTDWTPAPEDVDGSISAVKDYATQTINSNVSTINQTTSSIQAQVTSLQSSVSTIQTTLGNKADTTTVTSVTNRVSTLESSINGINASITTLNSNVSSVTTTANAALSNINNLSIGGRNYYVHATRQIYYGNGLTYVANQTECPYGFYAVGDQDANNWLRIGYVIKSNGYWTVSWEMKGSQSVPISVFVDICDTNQQQFFTTSDNTWKRFSLTVNVTNCDDSYNFVDFENFQWAYFFIRNIKVEKGNKATDWTPAPEDTDTQITNINSNVSSLQSSVSVLQSQIALKVEQSNIDSAITTVNNKITATNATISNLQSSINLQLNSITSTVSQTSSNKNLCVNSAFKYAVTTNISFNNTPFNYGVLSKTSYTSSGYAVAPVASDYAWWQRYDSAGDNYIHLPYLYAKVKPNTTYTVSFYYVMGDSGTQSFDYGSSFIYGRKSSEFGQATFGSCLASMPITYSNNRSNWRRCVTTITTASDTDSLMLRFGWNQLSSNFTEMLVTGVQIEEGSNVTDWVEGSFSQIGTTISQNASSVMTAFNNISKYFKVNADGATFGDTSTGDYTTVGSGGLKHHVNGTDYDYFYVVYIQSASWSVPSGTEDMDYVDTFVSYEDSLKGMLNGRAPKQIIIETRSYTAYKLSTWNSDLTSSTADAYIKSFDSTGFTVSSRINTYGYIHSSGYDFPQGYVHGGTYTMKILVLA